MFICFDLDDTLLNKKKEVSEYTLKVLNECKKKGHKLIINTARGHHATFDLIDLIKPDYSVVNAGALIYDKNLDVVYDNPISVDIVNKVIERIKDNASIITIQAYSGLYTTNTKSLNELAKVIDVTKGVDYDAYKIIPRDLDYNLAMSVKEEFDLDYCVYFNGAWSRFCNSGVTKLSGLKKIIEIENANMADTISFGDDLGDIEMLMGSGIGVCMENSVSDVLEKVKIVTKSCDDDGVAVYLNKYLNLGIEK